MSVRASLSLATAGLAALVLAVSGCSSDTNGTPTAFGSHASGAARSSAPTVTNPAGTSGGNGPAPTTSSAAPTSSSMSATRGGTGSTSGGGGTGNFCKDFDTTSLSKISQPGDLGKLLNQWHTLADEAPASIKSDVETVADYLDSISTGKAGDPSKLSSAATRIGQYYAAHCVR